MAETVAVVAVVVVVAVAGVAAAAPVASSAGPDAERAAQETPVNDTDIAPGERMAGVVGAEKAAVESEVAVRAFDRRIARANSSSAKASVVGAEVDNLQSRLDELAAREAELREARENGTLSTGEYRARLAKLYVEQRALQRLANRTDAVARDLPEQALRQQGVNVTVFRTLRSEARNLTGPEVADIARSVAGRNVGRPAGAGPPEFVENRTSGPGAGNGTGPPDERGPSGDRSGGPSENASSGASDAGNGNGPSGNETGPRDERGPNGNETGGPERGQGDGAGNSTGSNTGSADGNASASGQGSVAGNSSSGDDNSSSENGNDSGTGGGNGNADGNGNGGGDGAAERAWSVA